MRRLLFSLSLGLCSCSGQQVVSQSTGRALPTGYEKVVEVVLEQHVNNETSYCLKVVGQPPAEELVAALRDHGHEPLSCNRGRHELDFVEVLRAAEGRYSVTVDDTCGVLCGWQFMFQVQSDAAGQLSVANKQLVLEY
jgi:hypothetical protein